MPKRIQRRRTSDWRIPPNTIYVGRGTKWGNPCRVGMYRDYTADDAVRDFRRWLKSDPAAPCYRNPTPPSTVEIRRVLRGHDLACWCRVGNTCHADVLLEIANKGE